MDKCIDLLVRTYKKSTIVECIICVFETIRTRIESNNHGIQREKFNWIFIMNNKKHAIEK